MASREPPGGSVPRQVPSAGPPESRGPLYASLIGAGLGLIQNIWTARRADTAHQREVKDLERAGLNPILSTQGRGADVGQMESVAGSAAAAARTRGELELLRATADREAANALLARTQAHEISSFAPGRAALVQMQTRVAAMDEKQRREMLPALLARAQEEVGLTMAGARAARARAALDELAREGAMNEQEFQRMVGELGPWTRFFLEVLRGVRGR